MQLSKELISLIEKDIELKYISRTKHPYDELYIYNYTHSCQYDTHWDDATTLCRGLILDENYNIVARPFRKFFNFEELIPDRIPNESFTVTEKLDGSLGILYLSGKDKTPFISTRGSFTSDQAVEANQILHYRYTNFLGILSDELSKGKTYLFEIIYPENKVVVDYGKIKDLFLLAVIDNETGKDLPLEDIGFPIVKHYPEVVDFSQLRGLKEENIPNKEGYVIKFQNGFRMKLKFEEYQRLHKLITQCSSKVIWSYLKDNKDFNELLEKVPDEFNWWVRNTIDNLRKQYNEIEEQCKKDFVKYFSVIRKEAALAFQTCKYPSVLFRMFDNAEYASIIWKIVKPKFEKPFYKNEEEV